MVDATRFKAVAVLALGEPPLRDRVARRSPRL
jgi:hypothetical protein